MLRACAVTVLLAACLAAPAGASSLPGVVSGARPGPDALYRPAPSAPQLENTGPWRADPILVSGAAAYRDGEWLYQDYLYDDHGAAGVPDTASPYGPESHLYSPTAGTFTYPDDPRYAHNAADLVELRVRRVEGATAFRVTLNTLVDPARTAFTIALGDSAGPRDWPHGAGVSSPAKLFLTAHGKGADLVDAETGRPAGSALSRVDLGRRQIEVRVPKSAWDPGRGKVRMTIGVGLWDPEAKSYLAPRPGGADGATPGGGLPGGAAIVNVGPRFEEPWPDVNDPVAPKTMGDSAAGGIVQAAWWRERAQADALRLGDVSAFRAEVDFAKLAEEADDESLVPKSGFMNRILVSEHEFGQGLDPEKVCFEIGGVDMGAECVGRFVGRLQPYTIYVPDKPRPESGYGLTLLLHSLSANYNQYANSKNMSQLGDRGAGSIVITPAGRGPDGFYAGIAEADTFEVWADVARRYRLDPEWTVVSGYSMGGFGTYRMLARYPDLFARGFSVVGVPGSAADQLPSLRHTPVLAWNATADELVNVSEAEEAAAGLEAAGLRFAYWQFPTADHLTLATNDEYGPGAAWLGDHRVDRNPAHVTYVVDPSEDSARARTVADHAYWLSDLRVRDAKAEPTGTIDARSEAMGVGDPEPGPVEPGAGALGGGAHGPMPYVERRREWGKTPEIAAADRLHVKARNIAGATVDARRARLSCSPELVVESDGPFDLRIACATLAVKGATCASRIALRLPRVRGLRMVAVRVSRGRRTVKLARGANLRRVVIRRPTRKAFRVRLTLRAAGGGKAARRVTVLRRVAACR